MSAVPGYAPATMRTVNVLMSDLGARFALAGPGSSRSGHVHAGGDFSGARGEAVLAMADGRVRGVWVQRAKGREDVSPRAGGVVRARQLGALPRGAGLYLELQHGPAVTSQLHTVYMHLDTAEVRTGQLVTAGQTLGAMGASGVTTEDVHLHFEVYEGPPDARGDQRDCLNPLGFQRYATARKIGGVATDRPGNGVWEVTHIYKVRCFPRSSSPRGRVGVDKPLPVVDGYYRWSDGTAVVGLGPEAPYAWRGSPTGPAQPELTRPSLPALLSELG